LNAKGQESGDRRRREEGIRHKAEGIRREVSSQMSEVRNWELGVWSRALGQ